MLYPMFSRETCHELKRMTPDDADRIWNQSTSEVSRRPTTWLMLIAILSAVIALISAVVADSWVYILGAAIGGAVWEQITSREVQKVVRNKLANKVGRPVASG